MKPATAKAKGTATETAWVRWARQHLAPQVERRRLTGAHDQGDIAGLADWCIEIKSGARLNLPGWMRELATETANAGARFGALVIRPAGKPDPADWWIVLDPDTFRRLLSDAGWLERWNQ